MDLTLAPRRGDIWFNLGNAERAAARHESAVASFRHVAKHAPNLGGAWLNMGLSLRTLGRHAEAIDAFAEAARLMLRDPLPETERGSALKALNRLDEAIAAHRAALARSSGHAIASYNLANALRANDENRGSNDPDTRARYMTLLARHGVDQKRLHLVGYRRDISGHLGLYGEIDVALDPFPYNGTTTTCEALYMGVPVVTLRGDRHAARVGASLMHAIGLDDLIIDSLDAYVETAARLAADLPRRAELRSSLRGRISASPLGDPVSLARAIENAYGSMIAATAREI